METGDHPARHPVHADPAKGQVHRGECNRTACERHGAAWFNIETRGLYCKSDAMGINEAPLVGWGPLCVEVDAKPSIEEMDRMYRDFFDAVRKQEGM
jgi:hypothetical protein